MTTDSSFNFDELDEMDRMFQELGLSSSGDEFEPEYDEFDPNNPKKRDEFDLDLEDLDSLISPDSSLEAIFDEFFVAERPYLSSEQGDSNDDEIDFDDD